MDEETKAAFARLEKDQQAMEAHLMTRVNAGFDRVINDIISLKADFQNSKGFVLEDAIVTGRCMLSIEDGLTALTRKNP